MMLDPVGARFVFVLYILLMYTCFLWCLYGGWTGLALVPLLCLSASLLGVVVVTLYQLQVLARYGHMRVSDRWSTVLWCGVHVYMCVLFVVDGVEWIDILVTLTLAGIMLTCVMFVVAVCACYVTMHNSSSWRQDVCFVCICVWVFVQFLSVRLPAAHASGQTTSVPVLAVAGLRLSEHVEFGVTRGTALEMLAWCVCVCVHVLSDLGMVSLEVFYGVVVCGLCVVVVWSGHGKWVLGLVALPWVLLVLLCCWCVSRCRSEEGDALLKRLDQMYDEWTGESLVTIPLEVCSSDEDWQPTPL